MRGRERARGSRSTSSWACALLALAACGGAVGSKTPPGNGGAPSVAADGGVGGDAGTTHDSGANAGGGSAASGTPPMSKRQACLEYLRAQENRNQECHGLAPYDDAHLPQRDQCPDLLFSDGSVRTIEGTFACAQTWKSFPCDALNAGAWPDCALPGTRAAGMPCVFGSQCDSDVCYAPGTGCGMCEKLLPPGGDCSAGANTTCPNGQTCLGGSCTAGTAPKLAASGQPCTSQPDCAVNLSCIDRPDGTHTCGALPSAGQPCATINGRYFCALPSRCDKSLTCLRPPQAGEACGVPDSTSVATPFCADGTYCSAQQQCVRLPEAGEPCATDASGVPDLCASTALCKNGTCGPRLGPGEACHPVQGNERFQGDCIAGLACACEGASCVTGTCLTLVAEGGSCGAPNSRCEAGTACLAGSCVAPESLGLFMQRCGGH